MDWRERIGTGQLGFLVYGFLMGSSLLLPMGAQAEEAAWLASIIGGAAGMLLIYLIARLSLRYPDRTLIGYSRLLLGRWAGSLVGLLYLWYSFHLGSLVLRNFGEFLVTSLLPTTPISVIIITLMLLCAYAVRHGLEPLARAAQVLVLTVGLMLVLVGVLLAKEVRPVHLLPVLGSGPTAILQSAVTIMAFPFGEAVLFGMIFTKVRPQRRLTRATLIGMVAAVATLALLGALSTAVLGAHVRGASRFATLSVIRQISVADFITNLDAVAIGAWVSTGFVKISLCLYVCATCVTELLGLRHYRPYVLPIGAAMVSLSLLVFRDTSQMAANLAIWPTYSAPFQILIPLLLLGVSLLRPQRQMAQGSDR